MLNRSATIAGDIANRWLVADQRLAVHQWGEARLLIGILLLVSSVVPRPGPALDLPAQMLETDNRLGATWLLSNIDPAALRMLPLVIIALIVCFGVGVNPRLTGTTASVLILVGFTIVYSAGGKIVHMQWVPYSLLILSLAGWGEDRLEHSPRLLLAWIISWGMFMSGAAKIIGRWGDPSFSVVELRVLGFVAVDADSGTVASAAAPLLRDSIVAEVLDLTTIALEIGVLALVSSPTWFRRGLVVLLAFHIGIWQMLGISFAGILPAYVVFFAESFRGPRRWHYVALVIAATAAALAAMSDVADTSDWVFGQMGGSQLFNQGLPLVAAGVWGALTVFRLGVVGRGGLKQRSAAATHGAGG